MEHVLFWTSWYVLMVETIPMWHWAVMTGTTIVAGIVAMKKR